MFFKKTTLAFCALLCCLLLYSCHRQRPALKIGMVVNLSGIGGAGGEHCRNGVLLAIKEINEAGGIRGRPVELLVRDDQGTIQGAIKADMELIAQGVPVIIGHNRSSTTLAAYPIITSRDILLITACSATTRLSGKEDLFFRTCVDCGLYGRKSSKLLEEKGVATLALLMDMANPGFVTDYASAVQRYFSGQVYQVHFQSGSAVDWDEIIHDLFLHEPDAVMLLTEATMTGIALQKLKAAGYKGLRLASLWAQMPELLQYASEAGEDLSIITYINPEPNSSMFEMFKQKMSSAFHEEANARSAAFYELMMILAHALDKAKDMSGPGIASALISERYEGLMGMLSFDKYGDVIRPVYEVTIKKGRFVLERKI